MAIRKTGSRPVPSSHVQKTAQSPGPKKTEAGEKKKADGFAESRGVIASKNPLEVKPTKVPHAWARQLKDTALDTAAQLKTAGKLLHEGGDALEPTDKLGLEAHTLGTQSSTLGTELVTTAEASFVPAGTVRADVDSLHQRAQGLLERATEEQKTRNFAQRAIDKIGEGAQAIGRALKTYTHGIAKAVDYEENIDALGEEDTYKLGVEAFLMAAGISAEGSASIDVAKKDGLYSVSMGGDAAAGIFVDFGIKLFGVGADAFAQATAGRGVRYELQFATADEAKKAVGLMLGRLGRTASGRELTDEQRDLFRNGLHAVELHGKAAALGWAMLRLPSVFAAVAEAEAKATRTVRLSLGEKPALTLTEESSASLEITANLATKGDVLGLLAIAGGKGEAKVALHRKIELDQKPDLSDPMKSLKELAATVDRSKGEHTVQWGLESKGGAMGSGGGFALGLGVNTTIDEVKKSGAIAHVLRGDLEGALGKLPEHVELDGTFEKWADYGVAVGPAVYFMSFGAGLELQALRKDVDFEHKKTAKAPVKAAYGAVKQWLAAIADD